MTKLAIQGIGAVGAFGSGVADLRQALATGQTSLGRLPVPIAGGSVELPAALADSARLDEFVPKRALRRIDHFSKLALLGACLALHDAGRMEADRKRLGVLIATGYGAMGTTLAFLDSFIDGGDICSSPTHFSNSVHNAAAANISILLGTTGPSLTISQFEMSVPSALLTARQWLADDRVDAVLVGGVDEAGEILGYCWQRYFGVPEGKMQPLDFSRQSAFPGEGAAFFLLDRAPEAKYGFLAGIEQGKVTGALPPLPSRLILGADGQQACAAGYPRQLPADARIAAYTPLWGSLPVGQAFDLAAAALAAGEDRLFTSPAAANATGNLLTAEPFGNEALGCLKLGRYGDYGLLTVVR